MRLVVLDEVKSEFLELDRYIDELGVIIRKWSVRPLRIGNNRLLDEESVKIYNALWALGTRFIPVIDHQVDYAGDGVSLDILDVYYNVKPSDTRVYENVLELVSRDIPTPLVKLRSLGDSDTRIWAKLEWYHPFSLSIKDRVAWYMLINAINRGLLKSKTIYEPTSTNTGLGLVGLANYLGLKTRVYLPSTTQKCMDYIFLAMGTEVVRKDIPLTTGLIDTVVVDAVKDNAVVLNQFENDLNFIVHLKYTAKEIDYQLRSIGVKPSAVMTPLGTSGHFSALSFYFKNRYSEVEVIGIQPSEGTHIPGMRRIETGMKWLKYIQLDRVIDISLEEAFKGILHVARKDGLLIGFSGGAVVYALKELIDRREIRGDVVIVIPDHGTKYIELMQSMITKLCPDTPYTG